MYESPAGCASDGYSIDRGSCTRDQPIRRPDGISSCRRRFRRSGTSALARLLRGDRCCDRRGSHGSSTRARPMVRRDSSTPDTNAASEIESHDVVEHVERGVFEGLTEQQRTFAQEIERPVGCALRLDADDLYGLCNSIALRAMRRSIRHVRRTYAAAVDRPRAKSPEEERGPKDFWCESRTAMSYCGRFGACIASAGRRQLARSSATAVQSSGAANAPSMLTRTTPAASATSVIGAASTW